MCSFCPPFTILPKLKNYFWRYEFSKWNATVFRVGEVCVFIKIAKLKKYFSNRRKFFFDRKFEFFSKENKIWQFSNKPIWSRHLLSVLDLSKEHLRSVIEKKLFVFFSHFIQTWNNSFKAAFPNLSARVPFVSFKRYFFENLNVNLKLVKM